MRRPRPLAGAAVAACTVAAVFTGPVAFAGTTPATDLYVSDAPGCDDSGTGTQAVPFCSLQLAADTALPGQTVHVAPSLNHVVYQPVTFTHSGTASQPVTFVAAPSANVPVYIESFTDDVTPVTVSGAHDLTLRGFTVSRGPDAVDVVGSQDVTLDQLTVTNFTDETVGDDVRIDGASSGVTVSRSDMDGDFDSGVGHNIDVAAGAHDITVTTNYLHGPTASSVAMDGVTNADLTSNTFNGFCGSDASLTGATTGVMENNVFATRVGHASADCPDEPLVSVGAAADVTADFNELYTDPDRPAYSWGGVTYATAAARTAATGAGPRDFSPPQPDPWSVVPPAAVDSADSDAPGELPTDIYGFRHVNYPGGINTGTGSVNYADRGAFELHDTVTVPATETAAPTQGVTPLTVSVPVGDATSAWHEPLTYSADFGDGSAPVTGTADAPPTHTYTTPGAYTVTITATDADGVTQSRTTRIIAATPDPSPAGVTGTAVINQGVLGSSAEFAFSLADSFQMASQTVDYGDGTTDGAEVDGEHTYARPGVYPVTVTRTDVLGRVTTAATTFTATDGYAPTMPAAATETIPAHGTWTVKGTTLMSAGGQPVELRVDATGATAGGWLTTYAAGGTRPSASTLNFPAGHGASNQETVVPDAAGDVAVYNGAASPVKVSVQVVGLLAGAVPGGSYHPVDPATLVDTRYGTGGITGPVGAGKSITVPVAGTHGVPADATAVTLDVAANTTKAAGSLTVAPHGTTGRSLTASYWAAGESVTNLVTLPLTDGKVTLTNNSKGTANLIAALAGWYTGDATGSGGWPVTPVRVLNTQTGLGETGGKPLELAAGGTLKVKVAGTAGLPATGLTAADLNLTVSAPTASGWLVAYPDGTTRPTAGALNYTKGHTIAGQALIKVGTDGYVDLYNPTGTPINVFADLHAAWLPMD